MQASTSRSRIVTNVDSFVTNTTGGSKLRSSQDKLNDEKRRMKNDEDARKKRDELLRAQAEEKKRYTNFDKYLMLFLNYGFYNIRKREEKELKNKLAREAKEKLEAEKRLKAEKEKEEKAKQAILAKEKEREEMEKRKLAQQIRAQVCLILYENGLFIMCLQSIQIL